LLGELDAAGIMMEAETKVALWANANMENEGSDASGYEK
jgi:hypothetical protein